jgi:hypothetical protein
MAARTANTRNPADEHWQTPIDGSGQLIPVDEPIEETAADRVAAMLAESMGDDRAKVKLNRAKPDQPGKFEWCKDYNAADFEAGGFEMVRRDWGPGEYQVILYGTVPGTKKYTIRAREVVLIAHNNSDTTTTIPGVGAVPTGIEHAFRAMAQQNEQIMRALTDRPQVDPMAQMRMFFEMMTLAKGAFGGDRSPIGELLEGIKQIQGVAKDLAPGAEKEPREPSMMELAPKVLDILSAGMQQRQQPMLSAPQISVPVSLDPSRVPTSPTPQNPQQFHQPPEQQMRADIDDNPALLILQGYLTQLVDMAKNGATADAGAELLAEKLPDEFVEFIKLPTWFELLAFYVKARVPEIVNHRAWLTQVRNLAVPIIDAAVAQGDDDGTPNPAPSVSR